MAGAITHLLVAEEAVGCLPAGMKSVARFLTQFRPFLLLGCVSPDLPYATSPLAPQSVWSDRMHYQDTNLVPLRMLANIASMPKSSERQAFLAFLAGYVAHCVTDATIHPIVLVVVGPYATNKKEHRICEMVQDSLLFIEESKKDLHGSEYVSALKACAPKETLDKLLVLWGEALRTIHFRVDPAPDPRTWHFLYANELRLASDSDIMHRLARPLVGPKGPIYLTSEEINENFPHKKKFWYDEIKLPPGGKERGTFAEDGYRSAAKNVAIAWAALWKDAQGPGAIGKDGKGGELGKVLANWDLDTGADMDKPDPRITYWPCEE